MKTTVKLFVCFWVICNYSQVFSQIENYKYLRKLNTGAEIWNRIILPNNVFKDIKADFSDLRVFGITERGDTLEAPYILNEKKAKTIIEKRDFDLINEVRREDGYFYTFSRKDQKVINELQVNFRENNYDRKIKLEGSNDNRDWYVILEEYRILSIANDLTKYTFNSLKFADNNFKYIRLSFKSEKKPHLESVSINNSIVKPASKRDYKIINYEVVNNEKRNETIINFQLPMKVPVSGLQINVRETYDYFRSLKISVLGDSIEQNGIWKYIYRDIFSGIISSRENNGVIFNCFAITNRIRIIIGNQDNIPITFSSVNVWGNEFEMIVRTTETADYYLAYGNELAYKPRYDVVRFRDNIPADIHTAELEGDTINKISEEEPFPIFREKIWLWLIIIFIVLILGGFTLRMIKKE